MLPPATDATVRLVSGVTLSGRTVVAAACVVGALVVVNGVRAGNGVRPNAPTITVTMMSWGSVAEPSLLPQTPIYDETMGETDAFDSKRTTASAARLRSASRYEGVSVKHTRLTRLVYRLMRQLGAPRRLAIACWSASDWESAVAVEIGMPARGATTLAFWIRLQPRWLHLSPHVCRDVQALLDSSVPSGRRASALSTVLHEALHAHGLRNEAQTNCYAVQLVPLAGRSLHMRNGRADYLGKLALRYDRSHAPPGYWNASSCRDDGLWDLRRERANLI